MTPNLLPLFLPVNRKIDSLEGFENTSIGAGVCCFARVRYHAVEFGLVVSQRRGIREGCSKSVNRTVPNILAPRFCFCLSPGLRSARRTGSDPGFLRNDP